MEESARACITQRSLSGLAALSRSCHAFGVVVCACVCVCARARERYALWRKSAAAARMDFWCPWKGCKKSRS